LRGRHDRSKLIQLCSCFLAPKNRTFRIIGNVRQIARLAGEAGFAALRHRRRRRIAMAERGKAKATRARNGPSSLRHLCKAIFETNLCNDNSCVGYGLCEESRTCRKVFSDSYNRRESVRSEAKLARTKRSKACPPVRVDGSIWMDVSFSIHFSRRPLSGCGP